MNNCTLIKGLLSELEEVEKTNSAFELLTNIAATAIQMAERLSGDFIKYVPWIKRNLMPLEKPLIKWDTAVGKQAIISTKNQLKDTLSDFRAQLNCEP